MRFIGPTAILFLFPLVAVLGTPILWVLLFFFVVVVGAMWFAIWANRKHRRIEERLVLWADRVTLEHQKEGAETLSWEANPYWVELKLTKEGGPVENYLTLRGQERTVEIGSFLAIEERSALARELKHALAIARSRK